jgi:hypothetical protein
MTLETASVVGFVDKRLEAMLRSPEMWGEQESVELQVLQLLEVRLVALGAGPQELNGIKRRYVTFVREQLGDVPAELLSRLLRREGREAELMKLLASFIEREQRVSEEAARDRFPQGTVLRDNPIEPNHPPRHEVAH